MENNFSGHWGLEWSFDDAQELGSGGSFGNVYRGRGRSGDAVAVKVIWAQKGILPRRLQSREIEIVTALRSYSHDHLIKVFDVGSNTDGDLYIVMELGEKSLAHELKTVGHLDENQWLDVMKQLTRGLIELHSSAIIHRDLKPDNAISAGGVWKLSDFGIAHDENVGTQTYTFTGAGTLFYMAPELFQLKSATIKTDLYALGCMAFQLLTGSPPFLGNDRDDFRRLHEAAAPPDLPDKNPAIQGLILRLLSKDPNDRHQDARAVRERLEKIERGLSAALAPLAELSNQHLKLRTAEAAAKAAEDSELAKREAMARQAVGDLEELLRDVVEELDFVLSDVKLEGQSGRYVIRAADASLTIQIWDVDLRANEGDPLVRAGVVVGANWMDVYTDPLANFVAEEEEGVIKWKQIRFRASPFAQSYALGPTHREHGFELTHFKKERILMLSSPVHVWSKTTTSLDTHSFVALFTEVLSIKE